MKVGTIATPPTEALPGGRGLVLEVTKLTKRFGPVTVLDDVDFTVAPGEVHALVGENGAGKSTMLNILAGVHAPDAGRIDIAGQPDVSIANPHHAMRLGIATVFQERSLFPHLSVADNLFVGRQPRTARGTVNQRELWAASRKSLAEVALAIDPSVPVGELSPAQQQLVEVAKAISFEARLILFDEPTAALTPDECQRLFALIGRLVARGAGIVYISHRLDEIFALAQRVTVLKDGRSQGTRAVRDTKPDELVRLMVGRTIPPRVGGRSDAIHSRPGKPSSAPGVEARDLHDLPGLSGPRRVQGVSFRAWPGEILGVAGLAGSGRTETALALIGARPASGSISVGGRLFHPRHPGDAMAAGIAYLPEDRRHDGLFPELGAGENMTASGLSRFGRWRLDWAAHDAYGRESCVLLHIACHSLGQPIRELSGGNQQKCLLARCLLVQPRVLIVDEPTAGIDVGAKQEVHTLLRTLADQGSTVIAISSDLPELLSLTDRIIVMRQGRIAAELDPAFATEEEIIRHASY